MKTALMLNFSVDKEKKTVLVEREFAAELPLVWEAFTKSKILDQWWAPKPWKARTHSQDFKEGGKWRYAMVGPNGEEHWAFFDYTSIVPQKSYEGHDGFTDPEGNINTEMPQSTWKVKFTQQGDHTLVTFLITHKSLADLETILEMGFKEGFIMCLGNLDELLAAK